MDNEIKRLLNEKDWQLIRILQNYEKDLKNLTEKVKTHIEKIKRSKNI